MTMTKESVMKKLSYKGFTLREVMAPDRKTVLSIVIEHRGEPVGTIHDDSVYIAQYYPSLNPDGTSSFYADAKKTIIMFSHPVSELDDAIRWLTESPDRIDTEKRQKRIDTIRRYYKERRHQ